MEVEGSDTESCQGTGRHVDTVIPPLTRLGLPWVQAQPELHSKTISQPPTKGKRSGERQIAVSPGFTCMSCHTKPHCAFFSQFALTVNLMQIVE